MYRYLNFILLKTIVIVLVLFPGSLTRAEDGATPTAFDTSKPDQSTALGLGSTRQTEGYVKRNVNLKDLSTSSSAATKSYDTPPEFYRWVLDFGNFSLEKELEVPIYSQKYETHSTLVVCIISHNDCENNHLKNLKATSEINLANKHRS